MAEDAIPRSLAIFFEVFEALPRQGPGGREQTEEALGLCSGLAEAPDILDLGCGAGAQTIGLAQLTSGSIVALDSHAPLIATLLDKVAVLDLKDRVKPILGDMAEPQFDSGSFDLIWSEGALYNIGIEKALDTYHDLLRPGGYIAFTDAVWRKDDPPAAVRNLFADYSTMGNVEKVCTTIRDSRFNLVGHFPMPDKTWWENFYTPMLQRIKDLRQKYAGDSDALKILDDIAVEPEIHRQFSDFYGYEFFVAQRE